MSTTGSVSGFMLTIDPKVIADIEKVDKHIQNIATNSKAAAASFNSMFGGSMASNIGKVADALERVDKAMAGIAVKKLDNLTNLSTAMAGISHASSAAIPKGFIDSIKDLAAAVGTIDKTATTGANRLGRIATAISSLNASSPNPALFKTIADGINYIGSTSAATIANVTDLAKAMATLAKDIRTVYAAQRNENASPAQYNKLYKEQADLIRQKNELERKGASISAEEQRRLDAIRNRIAEINVQIDALNKKKQTAATDLARVTGQQRVTNVADISTVKGAIDYARSAKTINQMTDAMKNLKTVMATVDPKSAEWSRMNAEYTRLRENINRVRRSMGEMQGSQRSLMDSSGQLARMLAGVFSVAAIRDYIKKMVEVRAQFELQQTALRAILQNKDEADRIFMQVQQLALQSPFSIMQMTTFTKQLAAYRIEADKLVGTTKMLADVSAGLGIDMQRLILAYGQVKAANYLRACLGCGTKVKMFDGTFKNVEDVVVGDVLMGDDEQPRHVSKLYQGEQQMYRVSYLGGEFRCNEHHILTVYDALTMRVSDVFVLDYLKEPYRYHGVKRINGTYKTFIMKVEKDAVDTYYGFSIDGNHRFIIEDNIVTHNTEVRQFTEAGLNITGELAKYFSEVKDEMVSVGDVMDMITKRMVRFEDVEEVFHRVTSAGGLFYDMQRKQAETLWGQLQRVKDAMSIMFNEIGKGNEGMIIGVVKAVRELLTHWRAFADALNHAAIAFGVYKAASLLAAFSTSKLGLALKSAQLSMLGLGRSTGGATLNFGFFTAAVNGAKAALFGLMTAALPLAIISTITFLVAKLYDAHAAAEALREDLANINEESERDYLEAHNNYIRLAEVVRDSNATYAERKEALDELNRTYGDILPKQALEYEGIVKMKDGYEDATEALKLYYEEQRRQKRIGTYQERIDKAIQDFAKDIDVEEWWPGASSQKLSEMIAETFREGIENGFKYQSQYLDLFEKKFAEYYNSGIENAKTERLRTKFAEAMRPWFGADFDDVIGYYEAIREESERTADVIYADNVEQEKAIIRTRKEYDALIKKLKDYEAALNALNQLNVQGKLWTPQTKDESVQAAAALKAYTDARIALGLAEQTEAQRQVELNNILSSNLAIQEAVGAQYERTLGAFRDGLNASMQSAEGLINTRFGEKISEEIEQINGSRVKRAVFDAMKRIAKLKGVGVNIFDPIKISAEASFADVRKQVDDAYKDLEDKLKRYQSALEEGAKIYIPSENVKNALDKAGLTQEQVDMATAMLAAFKSLSKVLGGYEKSNSRGRHEDKELKRWQEIKKAIEDANKAYEKYRKYYTDEEATQMVMKQYGEAFQKMGIRLKDYFKNGRYDAEALIKALEVLKSQVNDTTTERKRFLDDLIRQIESEQVDIRIKAREESIKELKKQLDEMFANYELTKTFTKLGFGVEFTYILGGRPVSMEDIKAELAELSKLGTAEAEERIKILEEAQKKLRDMERKEMQERLKDYNKYLITGYGEAAKVQIKYLDELNQMYADFARYSEELKIRLTDPKTTEEDRERIRALLDTLPYQATQAARGMRQNMDKELSKVEFERVLNSPLFSEMFQDLSSMTSQTIDAMIMKIDELRESGKRLTLSQIRQLSQYREKLMNAKIENSPLVEGFKAIREALRLRSQGITAADASDTLAVSEGELQRLEILRDDLSYIIALKNKGYKIDGNAVLIDGKRVALSRQQAELAKSGLSELMAQLATTETLTDEQKALVAKWAGYVNTFKKAQSATAAFGQALQKVAEVGKEALGVIVSGIEMFGGEVSEANQAWIDFVSNMLEQCITLGMAFVELGLKINQAMGVIGIVATALTAVAGLFKTILRAHDAKIEKRIDNWRKHIENLSRAYEKLEKSVNSAYSAFNLQADSRNAISVLEKQKVAYANMIKLEEQKKKTDSDKIREWRQQIEDINEKIQELKESVTEKWGGFGSDANWASAAEDFSKTFLDSFNEVGDGLDALREKWDEYIQNLIIKQMTLRIVGVRMKKLMDMVDTAVSEDSEGGEYLTKDELAAINSERDRITAQLNEELKEYLQKLGYIGGSGKSILSDLQMGIQNITEPQAAAIEAYLNSMRFAVYEGNEIMNRMLAAIQAQYESAESPVLRELKGIHSELTAFHTDFRKVLRNVPGGTAVKIQ